MKNSNREQSIIMLLFLAMLAIVLCVGCAGRKDTDDIPLTLAPEVSTGVFDNGLTWYILENSEPHQRGALSLIVGAGSLMEDEDQLGIAHFNEHMLFNGTKNFEDHELVEYLESIGMDFGPDVNAYTSFEETVYRIEVPTDDAEVLGTAFQILEDWAHLALMEGEEIEQERLVIQEEWRLRSTSHTRIEEQWLAEFLKGTLYTERLPIGEPEVFMNLSQDRIRDFYQDWYRPDLMAVVAVGDFETEEVKQLIESHFAHIPVKEHRNPPARGKIENREPRVTIITDPKALFPEVVLTSIKPLIKLTIENDYRDMVIRDLYWSIFNSRMDELSRTTPRPFIESDGSEKNLMSATGHVEFYGQLITENVTSGINVILDEVVRITRHGVTSTELSLAKENLNRSSKQALDEKEHVSSRVLMKELVEFHLRSESSAFIGADKRYQLIQRHLQNITLEDVNDYARTTYPSKAPLLTLIMPEGIEPVPEEELLELLVGLDSREAAPPTEHELIELPVEQISEEGAVVEKKILEELNAEEWVLSNGARVIMKPTEFMENEILFYSFSPGGLSMVDDSQYFDGLHSVEITLESGLGGLSNGELKRVLAGKNVSVTPFINNYFEGFSGMSSKEDLELLFRLIRLYHTNPEFDSNAFDNVLTKLKEVVVARSVDPTSTYRIKINSLLWGNAFRIRALDNEIIDSLDIDTVQQVFTQRFSGFGDSVFVFVGNIDAEILEQFVGKYLANLPSGAREEWVDRNLKYDDNNHDESVFMGTEDAGQVFLFYPSIEIPSKEDRVVFPAIGDILSDLLSNSIRETLGGTYSVSANTVWAMRPEQSLGYVAFGCDPQRVEELTEATEDTIRTLQKGELDEEILGGIKEKYRRIYEDNLRSNEFWLDWISSHLMGDEPILPVEPDEYDKLLTKARVTRLANWIFNLQNQSRVVLLPESMQQ